MSTKKTFEHVAKILRDASIGASREQLDTITLIALRFAADFQEENPRFDRDRFMLACGSERFEREVQNARGKR